MNLQPLLEQLDELGYMVVPGFLDRETTAAVREHIDRLAPPRQPADVPDVRRIHDLRHPISGEIMPRLASNPALLDLAQTILKIRRREDLRLLEQVLIRTDPKPPPYGPVGWHVDFAFFPDQYESTPRRTYYHMVHACSAVEPGGGAFMIVPGSHKQTYAATAALQTEEELDAFKPNVVERAGVNLDEGIEVCANEGDLIVFNPMAVHSASGNARPQSRYVYFASFFDVSAQWLWNRLRAMKYRDNFPASLHDGLPPELRGLLEY
ncbi:MAG TPA: phytanoyl-CoA dioxygenase family protein [Chthonomonadaceae bacterium]|nr:phytanoyl-CoA dioxygenase family protein [Chthonomonadaceae bacterium]